MGTYTDKALPLIKQRLNRPPGDTALDDYLTPIEQAAELQLARKGIVMQDDADDLLLLVDFTVWKYQNRDQPGAMPQWLSAELRERWLSPKGRNPDGTIAASTDESGGSP